MEGNVVISKERLFELMKAELKLDMLEAGGVDNWSFYGESLSPEGTESYSCLVEILKEDIKKI